MLQKRMAGIAGVLFAVALVAIALLLAMPNTYAETDQPAEPEPAAASDDTPELDLYVPPDTGPAETDDADVDDVPETKASCPADGCPTNRSGSYRYSYRYRSSRPMRSAGAAIVGAPVRIVGATVRVFGKAVQGVRGRFAERRAARLDRRSDRLDGVVGKMKSRGYRSRR